MLHILMQSYDFGIQANQLSDILCRGATVSSIQSANNTLTRGTSIKGCGGSLQNTSRIGGGSSGVLVGSGVDSGDYDVPHPHPYTHHYMQTTASITPPHSAMSLGSRPGSAGGSGQGSGSGSSPGGGCVSGGSGGVGVGGISNIIIGHQMHSSACRSASRGPSVGDDSGGGGGSSNSGGRSSVLGDLIGGGGGIHNYHECIHYERLPIPVPIPIVPPPQQLQSEEEVEPAYATGI